VLKPVGLFQSMGVLRVNDDEELQQAFKDVSLEVERTKAQCAQAEDYRAAVANLEVKMVLEEFMDGNEQVVDLVLSDGECVYGNVTDNWPATRSFEPRFNETGSNSPSVLSAKQQAELIELSAESCKALGLRLGVLCVNAKYTSRGARLIEVNCRMGGMLVRDNNRLAWGVDLVEEHLFTTIGLPSRPPKVATPLRAIGGCYPSTEVTGTVESADVIDEYSPEKRPEVIYMHRLVTGGDEVLGPADAVEFPTWLCGYMCTAPTVEEAIALTQAINDDIVARIIISKPTSVVAAMPGKKASADAEAAKMEMVPTTDTLGDVVSTSVSDSASTASEPSPLVEASD
jgi:carnosine synthase